MLYAGELLGIRVFKVGYLHAFNRNIFIQFLLNATNTGRILKMCGLMHMLCPGRVGGVDAGRNMFFSVRSTAGNSLFLFPTTIDGMDPAGWVLHGYEN